jgi:hypothetical protein
MADDDLPTPPLPPSRTLRATDGSPHPGYLSPGARKEKLRQQRTAGAATSAGCSPRRRAAAPRAGPAPPGRRGRGPRRRPALPHRRRRGGRLFPGRLHVELQRHRLRDEEHRNQASSTSPRLRLPLVATNGVRYARRRDKDLARRPHLHPRGRHHLDAAGRLLEAAASATCARPARWRCSSPTSPRRGAGRPSSPTARLHPRDLGYRFPDYPLPPGETPHLVPAPDHLERRARPLPAAHREARRRSSSGARPDREARPRRLLPHRLGHRPFCRRENILVQGRGSAANSAVCYALSITAVDPVKMELLFERFLSEERGEWPDIDLDLPSGDQREKVIQHVYETLRRPRRGDDGERDHLPRPLGGARGGQGARLLARAGRPLAKQLGAWTSARSATRPATSPGARRGSEGGGGALDPEDRASQHFEDGSGLGSSRTSPATSGSTRAAWSSPRGGSTRWCRSSRPRCRAASSSSGTRTTAPTSASSRSTSSASACSPPSRR